MDDRRKLTHSNSMLDPSKSIYLREIEDHDFNRKAEIKNHQETQTKKTSKTLFEIIREEEEEEDEEESKHHQKNFFPATLNWKKPFKDKLRIRRVGATWSSFTNFDRAFTSSSQSPKSSAGEASLTELKENSSPNSEHQTKEIRSDELPGRVSLRALLEQTAKEREISKPLPITENDDDDDDDDDDYEETKGGEYVCCVCMVVHKGAAFIPCGHTFCRLCSKELWVSRDNCPLCNGFILEILHIF